MFHFKIILAKNKHGYCTYSSTFWKCFTPALRSVPTSTPFMMGPKTNSLERENLVPHDPDHQTFMAHRRNIQAWTRWWTNRQIPLELGVAEPVVELELLRRRTSAEGPAALQKKSLGLFQSNQFRMGTVLMQNNTQGSLSGKIHLISVPSVTQR